jgi:hypothetical protein
VSARLSGRAKGTRGSVSVTVNRHEELSDRSAPYADFGHGSLFEAAPGARQFGGAAESPTKSLFMPIEICKEHGGLHAYFNRREAAPSGAASGHAKPPSSGQAAPSLDLGVRCGPPSHGLGRPPACGNWNCVRIMARRCPVHRTQSRKSPEILLGSKTLRNISMVHNTQQFSTLTDSCAIQCLMAK